jgi:hypothetical protein
MDLSERGGPAAMSGGCGWERDLDFEAAVGPGAGLCPAAVGTGD